MSSKNLNDQEQINQFISEYNAYTSTLRRTIPVYLLGNKRERLIDFYYELKEPTRNGDSIYIYTISFHSFPSQEILENLAWELGHMALEIGEEEMKIFVGDQLLQVRFLSEESLNRFIAMSPKLQEFRGQGIGFMEWRGGQFATQLVLSPVLGIENLKFLTFEAFLANSTESTTERIEF